MKEWFGIVLLVFSMAVSLRAEETKLRPKNMGTDFPYQWVIERHSENPVLHAIPGTWEAFWFVVQDVLKIDGKYYMYYGGSDQGNKNTQLGLATSTDGVKWKRHPNNPIWQRAWHNFLRDVRVYRFGEEDFWMYYSDGDQHIDLARSTDGIHWKNYQKNPILKKTQPWEDLVMQERILRIGKKWYMWYSTYDKKPRVTGMATSTDGIRWKKYKDNPVLPLGEPGQWDDYSAFQPSVFLQDGHFHMIYTGSSKANPTKYRWGYAYSKDGINWKKSPRNPVFVPGDKGSWDSGKVSCHTLVRTGDSTFNIYYAGATSPRSSYHGIGLLRARLTNSIASQSSK
ncbi:MAG: glycoside hydrolase family 130 protein [Planctomycetota bacterium]|jgi:predicted GH43/DUF377 family glycosyl hydrolase